MPLSPKKHAVEEDVDVHKAKETQFASQHPSFTSTPLSIDDISPPPDPSTYEPIKLPSPPLGTSSSSHPTFSAFPPPFLEPKPDLHSQDSVEERQIDEENRELSVAAMAWAGANAQEKDIPEAPLEYHSQAEIPVSGRELIREAQATKQRQSQAAAFFRVPSAEALSGTPTTSESTLFSEKLPDKHPPPIDIAGSAFGESAEADLSVPFADLADVSLAQPTLRRSGSSQLKRPWSAPKSTPKPWWGQGHIGHAWPHSELPTNIAEYGRYNLSKHEHAAKVLNLANNSMRAALRRASRVIQSVREQAYADKIARPWRQGSSGDNVDTSATPSTTAPGTDMASDAMSQSAEVPLLPPQASTLPHVTSNAPVERQMAAMLDNFRHGQQSLVPESLQRRGRARKCAAKPAIPPSTSSSLTSSAAAASTAPAATQAQPPTPLGWGARVPLAAAMMQWKRSRRNAKVAKNGANQANNDQNQGGINGKRGMSSSSDSATSAVVTEQMDTVTDATHSPQLSPPPYTDLPASIAEDVTAVSEREDSEPNPNTYVYVHQRVREGQPVDLDGNICVPSAEGSGKDDGIPSAQDISQRAQPQRHLMSKWFSRRGGRSARVFVNHYIEQLKFCRKFGIPHSAKVFFPRPVPTAAPRFAPHDKPLKLTPTELAARRAVALEVAATRGEGPIAREHHSDDEVLPPWPGNGQGDRLGIGMPVETVGAAAAPAPVIASAVSQPAMPSTATQSAQTPATQQMRSWPRAPALQVLSSADLSPDVLNSPAGAWGVRSRPPPAPASCPYLNASLFKHIPAKGADGSTKRGVIRIVTKRAPGSLPRRFRKIAFPESVSETGEATLQIPPSPIPKHPYISDASPTYPENRALTETAAALEVKPPPIPSSPPLSPGQRQHAIARIHASTAAAAAGVDLAFADAAVEARDGGVAGESEARMQELTAAAAVDAAAGGGAVVEPAAVEEVRESAGCTGAALTRRERRAAWWQAHQTRLRDQAAGKMRPQKPMPQRDEEKLELREAVQQ